ncbi:basic salivary proline-rich protein 2-like [Hippocampus zosterae]|uniref:basic salivary proline-rich protein 2-like n=1 Tax=Hippocampus zosterae TaxID=109293 RepID=UPI00223E52FA|nr:basic salivary proline-rich protein 2-like [Hippocampus zosterae]
MPGAPNDKGLKGDVPSPRQPSSTLQEGASPQRPIIEGGTLPAPEPTSGRLVLVTKDQYQKLPLPVPQGKNFMQPQATPSYLPQEPKLGPEFSPGSALTRLLDKSLTPPSYEAGPHNNPAGGRPVTPPQENGGGASISKEHRPEPGKPDCSPGTPNGQWMKIPRPGAGVSAGSNTKGYGAVGPNRLGANSASGPAGYAGPNTGYGAGKINLTKTDNDKCANSFILLCACFGLGYPNAGVPQQPIYRPGASLGGGAYVKGSSYPGRHFKYDF